MSTDPSDDLRVTVASGPRGPTVYLRGAVDLGTVAGFIAALYGAGPIVRVDCEAVTFMDSSGIRALVMANRGHTVHVVRPSTSVRHLLDATGHAGMILDEPLAVG